MDSRAVSGAVSGVLLSPGTGSLPSCEPSLALPTAVLELYLSPTGSDSNCGLTPQTPLLTLRKANLRLAELLGSNPHDAVVHVGLGRYRGQTVRWSFSMPANSITILGQQGLTPSERPIFDGASGSEQATFFTIARDFAGADDQQNISIKNLRITNYFSAISIRGGGAGYLRSVGAISIQGVSFDSIGRAFKPGPLDSHAAIFISHSDGNRITGNHFDRVTNDSGFPEGFTTYGGLHAIYVIRSSGTVISYNHFRNIYARRVVKFRDFSNFGVIRNNYFYDRNTTLLGDQYCDTANTVCDSYQRDWNECPSWGIRWENNVMKYPEISPFNPILAFDYWQANAAYCGSSKFWADHQLDPTSKDGFYRQYLRYLSRDNRVLPDL